MIFGNYILDGANQGFCFFFIWACRRGGVESRCIRTRRQMPPRRRAFHCNNFGLKPTTITRDAKSQVEPPSRQGTHSHQNYFRFNPSRMLVEPYTRFAASDPQPRLNVLPRRDLPAHCPTQGLQRPFPGYRAFVPPGHRFDMTLPITNILFLPHAGGMHGLVAYGVVSSPQASGLRRDSLAPCFYQPRQTCWPAYGNSRRNIRPTPTANPQLITFH